LSKKSGDQKPLKKTGRNLKSHMSKRINKKQKMVQTKNLQELLCEEAEVEIKSYAEILETETQYDPLAEVRTWLNPVAGTSGTYSFTTRSGDDKDKDDEGGSD